MVIVGCFGRGVVERVSLEVVESMLGRAFLGGGTRESEVYPVGERTPVILPLGLRRVRSFVTRDAVFGNRFCEAVEATGEADSGEITIKLRLHQTQFSPVPHILNRRAG